MFVGLVIERLGDLHQIIVKAETIPSRDICDSVPVYVLITQV